PRIQAGLRKDRQHVCNEFSRAQLDRRNVDRDPYRWQACVLPAAGLAAGFSQDPLADRYDGATLVRGRYEVGRSHESALGMAPADERLDADDRARIEV